jgi:hypothetical protein
MAPDVPFTDRLEAWLRQDGPKTLGDLREVFAEKLFATTILLLMFVPALPLPTGGVTHVLEVIAIVVAAQMVLGRQTLWLPDRWQGRELGALTTERAIPFMVRWVRRLEGISRQRGASLFQTSMHRRILGSIIIVFALGAALAPPFSGLDTLPAMGAAIVALAIILEDVVVLAIGTAVGLLGIALIVALGATIARLARDLL